MMRFMRNRRKSGKKSSEIPSSSDEIKQGDGSVGEPGESVILTGVKSKDPEFGASEYPGTDIRQKETEEATTPASTKPTNDVTMQGGKPGGGGSDDEELERLVASEPHYSHPGDVLEEEGDSVITVVEHTPTADHTMEDNAPVYATVKKLTPPLSLKAQQLDDRYTPDKEYRDQYYQNNNRQRSQEEDPHREVRAMLEGMSGGEEEEEGDNGAAGGGAKVEDYYIYVTEETLQKGPNGAGCVTAMSSFGPPPPDPEYCDPGAVGGMIQDNVGHPGVYGRPDGQGMNGPVNGPMNGPVNGPVNGPMNGPSDMDMYRYGHKQPIGFTENPASQIDRERSYAQGGEYRNPPPDPELPPPDEQPHSYSPPEGRKRKSPNPDYPGYPDHRRGRMEVEEDRGSRSSPEEDFPRPPMACYKADPRDPVVRDQHMRYPASGYDQDPRSRALMRQVSAPAHAGYYDDRAQMPSDEDYGAPMKRQSSSTYDCDPRGSINDYDYDRRLLDKPYTSERELGLGGSAGGGPASIHGYESDRSDYDNYARPYNYNRRKRRRDELVLRTGPSGGYIERTSSMPMIRNERPRHGYPSHSMRRYGYPDGAGRRGDMPEYVNGYRDERGYKQHPRHGQYRERPHRELRPPGVRNNPYGAPYSAAHLARSLSHPQQQQQPVYQNPHNPAQRQQVGPGARKEGNGQSQAAKAEVEKLSRASPSGSGSSSSVSQKSGRKQGEARVSFKEEKAANGKGSGEESTTFPKVIEVDMEDGSAKALLAAEQDQEDGISAGSDTSKSMEAEGRRRGTMLIRRSVALWFAWLCMGFYTEVVGPNIPYLQSRINGTSSDIAISLASRGAGLLLGTSIGGLLCEVSPNWLDLWISTSLILGALCASAVPWSLNIIHLCLTLGLSGFSKGFLQVATVTLAFRLWTAKRVKVIIFLIHMAYAIGAAPCAQLAYLFDAGVLEKLLLGANETLSSQKSTYSNGDHVIIAHAVKEELEEKTSEEKILTLLDYIPRPMYPFDIAAVMTFICGAVFLVFFGSAIRSVPADAKLKPVKETEPEKPVEKPPKWFLKDSCGLRAGFSILVFFALPMAILAIFGSFHHLYILQNSDQQLKTEALLIQTIFWAAVAVGRLVALVSTRCMAPNGLTITCLTVSIVSTALIWVYGEKYRIFIWIFTVLLGLATGPILPAGLTICNLCISPTALGVAVAFFFQALGDGAFSWMAGFLLHRYLPIYLMYVSLASVGLSFLLYLPIIPILAKKRQGKNKKNKNGKSCCGKSVG